VDFIVFSLSFSAVDDITKELLLSKGLLKSRGSLIIADLKHRFEPNRDFYANMEAHGFRMPTKGTTHMV